MPAPHVKRCPKCHGRMFGPKWESMSNRLRYSCGCGYSMTEPAMDADDDPLKGLVERFGRGRER